MNPQHSVETNSRILKNKASVLWPHLLLRRRLRQTDMLSINPHLRSCLQFHADVHIGVFSVTHLCPKNSNSQQDKTITDTVVDITSSSFRILLASYKYIVVDEMQENANSHVKWTLTHCDGKLMVTGMIKHVYLYNRQARFKPWECLLQTSYLLLQLRPNLSANNIRMVKNIFNRAIHFLIYKFLFILLTIILKRYHPSLNQHWETS